MDVSSDDYHVIEFDDLGVQARFTMQLLNYVGSREGFRFMAGEPRAIVWGSPTVGGLKEGRHVLYLNATALEAAREVGLSFEVAGRVGPDDLPEGRALLLGQNRDWDR